MSLARAVGRNTIIQFVGKILGTGLGLITISLLQRYLGATGYGAYTTAMAYLGFLSVLADLGLYLMLIRELAKPNADAERVVGNLLGLRWVSAALILGAGVILVNAFPYSPEIKQAVLVGSFAFMAIAATQLLTGIFQTKLQMGRVVGAELLGRVVLLIATVWAVTSQAGLQGAIIAVVAGGLVNLLLVWLSARKFFRLQPRFDFGYWKQMLRETWPIAVSVVLNLIYFRIDTIFLSLFASEYTVGLYGSAYRILEILNTFPIMFVGLLLPVLGRAFVDQDQTRFQMIFQRGFELLLTAALPIVVGGWILAEPILTMIGGPEFAPAAPALRLLLIAVAALFMNALSGHVVTIIQRQRQMVWTYLGVAIIGVTAYLTLIPSMGILGAATGTIITESLTAVVGFILVLSVMKFRLRTGTLPRVVFATMVMGLVAWSLREQPVWISLPTTALVYGAGLLITKALTLATIRDIVSHQPTQPPELPNA